MQHNCERLSEEGGGRGRGTEAEVFLEDGGRRGDRVAGHRTCGREGGDGGIGWGTLHPFEGLLFESGGNGGGYPFFITLEKGGNWVVNHGLKKHWQKKGGTEKQRG